MLKNIKQIISYTLLMACIIVITVTTVKIVEMIWPLENAKTLLVIVVVFFDHVHLHPSSKSMAYLPVSFRFR